MQKLEISTEVRKERDHFLDWSHNHPEKYGFHWNNRYYYLSKRDKINYSLPIFV